MLLLAVGLFGAMDVQANNDSIGNEEVCTLTNDVNGEPEAFVSDVNYKKDGSIVVTVRIRNCDGKSHRVKVSPTSQITGIVVEGSLYCTVCCDCSDKTASVTFNCKAGKEGDAAYCVAYTFNAEIVPY